MTCVPQALTQPALCNPFVQILPLKLCEFCCKQPTIGDASKEGLFALRLKLPKGYHIPSAYAPRGCSVSPCRRRCSPAPTRLSNEAARVHHTARWRGVFRRQSAQFRANSDSVVGCSITTFNSSPQTAPAVPDPANRRRACTLGESRLSPPARRRGARATSPCDRPG